MPVAATPGTWTLEQLHSLPDDGNKYELVRGELFVTPAPSRLHEFIGARLAQALTPYVASQGLGYVFRPRAVVRLGGSEVEPDLFVRQENAPHLDWDSAPVPSLVIEILSPTTRRRDRMQKRQLYLDAGVGEYWIVDPESATVTVARGDGSIVPARDVVRWSPAGATAALEVRLDDVFGL